jgi:hypothetical protein
MNEINILDSHCVVWSLACLGCLLQNVDILWKFFWKGSCENFVLKSASKSIFVSLTYLKWL